MDRRELLSGMLGLPILFHVDGPDEVIRRKRKDEVYVGGDELLYVNTTPTNFRLCFKPFKGRILNGVPIPLYDMEISYLIDRPLNELKILANEEINKQVELICLKSLKAYMRHTDNMDVFCGLNVYNKQERIIEEDVGNVFYLSYKVKFLVCERGLYED